MADELTRGWESEDIPDSDALLMRVHRALYVQGRYAFDDIPPGAFTNHPRTDPQAGMSTDWDKYAIPEETRSDRGRRDPSHYAVIELPVLDTRRIPGQTVSHTPVDAIGMENRAHTDVFGDKRSHPETRIMIRRIARIAIALE